MTRRRPTGRLAVGRLVAAVALGWLVAACNDPGVRYARPVDLPQPSLGESLLQHDVRFRAGQSELPAAEAAALRDFLARRGVVRTATMVVSVEGGHHGLATARRQALAAALRHWGYDPIVASGAGHGAAGDVGLVTIRQVALVQPAGCDAPNPHLLPHRAADLAISQFGCATAQNLGLMVVDPGHFAGSAPLGLADGERAAAMHRAYVDLPHGREAGETAPGEFLPTGGN